MPEKSGRAAEQARIEFLLHRDGETETRAWVERTLQLYREAIASVGHPGTDAYRPRFEQSIEVFEEWLRDKSSPSTRQ